MKKKVEVKFKDQWELAVALRDGREIYLKGYKLHYKEQKNGSPFRTGDSVMGFSWSLGANTYYEMVEAPWTDRLKDGPIPCWVGDVKGDEEFLIKGKILRFIALYDSDLEIPFDDSADQWKYAIPAKAKDLNLLENMEDV